MRYLLPTAALAAAFWAGAVIPAAAAGAPAKAPTPVESHVALHLFRHASLNGRRVSAHGRLRPAGVHRIKLVVRGPAGGVFTTLTNKRGTFAVSWRPSRAGNYRVRAYGIHDHRLHGSASAVRRLTVYRPAGASYYGPGLYGNGVACGGTLLPATLGVANRTLPCGTEVKLRYHGRSVTVPVIDRGPYVSGRDYDLTEATRDRLGFPGVGTVLANR